MTDDRNLQRDSQAAATAEGAFGAQIDGRLKQLHTSLPGIIASFNPDTQTASVQPAIKRIFNEQGAVNLPLCVDVPVCFPGGGDFFVTFPVKVGDECILIFSERAIDNWYAGGGTAEPAEYRLHDLSDGMAIVGINSQAKKIPDFNPTDTEFRSRDGETKVQITTDGTIKNINAGGSTELSPAGAFTINAPAGIVLNGNVTFIGNMSGVAGNGGNGNASLPGTLTATTDVVGGGKSLKSHVHSDVTTGDGNTGQPV
jgi:hypothetical protein